MPSGAAIADEGIDAGSSSRRRVLPSSSASDAEQPEPELDVRVVDRACERAPREAAPLEAPDHRVRARHDLAEAVEQLARDDVRRARAAEADDQSLELAHLLEPATGACLHRRRAPRDEPLARHGDAILAEPLRLVERCVGRLHQRAQVAAVVRAARDAEAQRQAPVAEVERLERALQAAAHGARVRAARRGQEQRELLPADAEDGVARAHAAPEHARDRAQRIVTGDVAATVVQLLEVVDVGQHERELDLGRGLDQGQRGLVEAPVVPEAGEPVGDRGALRALEHAQRDQRRRGVRDEQLGLLERLVGYLERTIGARDQEAEQLAARAERQADDVGVAAQPELLARRLHDRGVDVGLRERRAASLSGMPRRDHVELVHPLGHLHAVELEQLADEPCGQLAERLAVARVREPQERAVEPARPRDPAELVRRQRLEHELDDAHGVDRGASDRLG